MVYELLGLRRVATAAVTGTFDQEVPLETPKRRCLSLQESPFGNEATKDSLHQRGSPLRRGHFNEQLPLYFPCGPIHCCGRRCLGAGGGSFEMYLLIIWNIYWPGLVFVLTLNSVGLRVAFQLMEGDRSGVGIVEWPVAQVVRKQALHIKLSLY